MNITDQDSIIPLTPQVLHILLALAAAQDNGIGIMRTIKEDSGGYVQVASGTLYPAITRLLGSGYIIEIHRHSSVGRSGITKVYRLTPNGRYVLELELNRYHQTAKLGAERLKILSPNRVQ